MTLKRGRPLGVKAFAVLRTVSSGPTTVSALAASLQLSYSDAEQTVRRLVQGGHVHYGELIRNTGGRPARLVQSSAEAQPSACSDELRTIWRTV